jgi:hypothetical protein
MNSDTGKEEQRPDPASESKDDVAKSAVGTEAKRKGGIDSAKRQAERDWEDSAKESGD